MQETIPGRILFILILCLGYQTLLAQDNSDCIYLLEDAREAYNAGMVELVPDLLTDCLESNGLTGKSKNEAYRLVINSYLFDYLSDEADSLMDDFVADFPEYRAQNSDPQEFVFLLESHLRALGINPDQQAVDDFAETGSDTLSDRRGQRAVSKSINEFENSVGFIAGGNLSLPSTVEAYSVGDPSMDESSFGILPGLQLGATANLLLSQRVEVSFGLQYNLNRFSYNATPLSYTTYRYVEAQQHILLPLSVMYKLNPENQKLCYYVRGGVVPEYLLHATGRGTRTTEASSEDGLVVEKTDLGESRIRFNLRTMIGAGLRIPLNNAFFYVESRVSGNVLPSNSQENRYQDNDLSWVLYHVDSDFRLYQISICAGVCWEISKL